MTKNTLKRKSIRTLGKVLGITLIASVAIWLVILLFSWAGRQDRNAVLKQKQCWKEIYVIIEKSPKEKADWLRQTVTNQTSLFGNVNYCGMLKFIEDGQEDK
jgi:hypothetical protein